MIKEIFFQSMNESKMKKNNKIKILALFGKSGAGKDTILKWLLNKIPNSNKIIYTTTRPKRENEKQDEDYHFISDKTFYEKFFNEDNFLTISNFNNWRYGLDKNELKENDINIGIFSIKDILRILNNNKEIDILPVYIQAPDRIRLLRSIEREKIPNCKEICRRFLADDYDFNTISFDHEIYLNDKDNCDFYGILNRPKVADFLTSM